MSNTARILRLIVISSIFVLPFVCLIVSSSLFFPFITGKNFVFRLAVEAMAGAWLALAVIEPAYRPRRSWVFAALAAFVFLIGISDATGVNPFKSFWSNFERMDGWVTITHLLAYVIVAGTVLNTEKLWRRLFQTSLAVSLFLDLYGFSQIAGVLALGQGGQGGWTARIDATFGNPIYLAAYMFFHVFIAVLLWAQSWSESRPGTRMWFSLWYGSIIVLDTAGLLLTSTRGTILGLVAGAIIAGVLHVFTRREERWLRPYVIGGVVAVIAFAGILHAERDSAWVRSVGFLQRLATISVTDTTIQSRFLNMHTAWQGIKERPLLGWGQENYAIVFDKYFNPQMYRNEPWFDRVHNIIFDWWVAGGTLGLLAYFSIFAATLYVLWKGDSFTATEKSILTGLLAGYFIHNLAVFDNVTSYILFGTILAYVAWRETRHAPTLVVLPQVRQNVQPIVAMGGIACALAVMWLVNQPAYAQNTELIEAMQSQQGGVESNLEHFKKALSYNAVGRQEVREQLSQVATQITRMNVTSDVQQQFGQLAVQQMQEQEKASPLDARFPLFEGIIREAYGDLKGGASAYEKALSLAPKKQLILFQLGENAIHRDDMTAALEYYKRAYELAPDYMRARLSYAAAAITAKNDALADELLAPVIATGEAANTSIAAAYADRGAYGKIVTIWNARIAVQPDDVQAYFTLAAAYYSMRDNAHAISTLQAAERANPAITSQAEALIQGIKDGTLKR